MSVSVQISADDPAFRADPYSVYQRIRSTDPIFKHPLGVWLITRYADAVTILHDARFGHVEGRTAEYTEYLISQNRLSPLEFLLSHWILSKNPPDHTRLRGLVSKAFTPSVVEALRPRIQAMVDDLLGAAQGGMDIIADLAYPLPVMVIAELLGVPLDQREHFKIWSRDLIGVVDIMPDQEHIKRGNVAIEKF